MGSVPSRVHHRCFNEYNTRFLKRKSNYYLTLYDCRSGLKASFLREYPVGCYMYLCENCYYTHYSNERDNPSLENVKKYPMNVDDIKLSQNAYYEWYSEIPIPECDREYVEGELPEKIKMDKPKWIEFENGVKITN